MRIIFETCLFGVSISIWRPGSTKSDNTPSDRRPFLSTVMNEIERRRGIIATSTVENELTAVRSFTLYAGRQLTIGDINQEKLCGYERWLQKNDVSPNTSAIYMRSLRAVLNRCGADGTTLFSKVNTNKIPVEKRAVGVETVREVRDVAINPDSFLSRARALFLFSIMAKGMPFIDLAHLRHSDIHDGHIIYHRQKTRRRVSVPIEPCMQDIINRYGTTDGPYLFPLLKGNSHCEYAAVLKRYNRALHKLSELTLLPCILTSYTARHTWASLAYQHGIPLATISKSLGHSSPLTTQAYLKEIDDDTADAATRQLLYELLPPDK